MSGLRPFFGSERIDRLAHRRDDEAWIRARMQEASTRIVPVWRTRFAFVEEQVFTPLTCEPQIATSWSEVTETPVLLGEYRSQLYFALELPADREPREFGFEAEFSDLRRVGALLDPGEAALLAQARGVFHWSRRNRYCGRCGAATQWLDAGYRRQCSQSGCRTEYFPRTDPAIIVLVYRADRCFLARNPNWPDKIYSTLAGFVEPGETLENAVRREVWEEAGLRLGALHYQSSQPWPFPASIMIGFHAEAESDDFALDTRELEHGMWLSRDELAVAIRKKHVVLPSEISIARRLILDWWQPNS